MEQFKHIQSIIKHNMPTKQNIGIAIFLVGNNILVSVKKGC